MSETGKQLVPVQKNTLAVIRKQLDITDRLLKERALALTAEKADLQTGFTDPITGMEFVYVKGGTFIMGDIFGDGYDCELPTHQVTVNDFYIARYQVTQGEWEVIMGSNPSFFTDGGSNCPVEQVNWYDVQIYTSKLNQLSGKNYRLPTEAEWEYAARSGGKDEKYSGGDDFDAVAWYRENSNGTTHPVGQRQANGLGLYDMSGNVWEWVNDWYGTYSRDSQTNPTCSRSVSARVFRGGGWDSDTDFGRASFRGDNTPGYRNDGLGFRLVHPVQSATTLTGEKTDVPTDAVAVTVSDTGFTESLIYTDPNTGLMWPRNGNLAGIKMNLEDAASWTNNLSYGGYNDWRLPTEKEIKTFWRLMVNCPSEWFRANGFINVLDTFYWAPDAEDDLCTWVVNVLGFYDGCEIIRTNGHNLWPVRSEKSALGEQHIENQNDPLL